MSDITRSLPEETTIRTVPESLTGPGVEEEIAALANRLSDIARETDDGEHTSAAELVETLRRKEYRQLAERAIALAAKKHAVTQASRIKELLHHRNEFIRVGAAWVLAATAATGEIPDFGSVLLVSLRNRAYAIQILALDIVAMSRAASWSRQILRCVQRLSLRRGRMRRIRALHVIRRRGPPALTNNYLLRLAKMLAYRNWHIAVALSVLKKLGKMASCDPIINGLVQIMRSDGALTNLQSAIEVIQRMGQTAGTSGVAQCLVDLSSHANLTIRIAVARTVPAIRTELPPPGTAAVIMQLLRDDLKVQQTMADAVRDLSELEGRSDFLEQVASMLQDERPDVYAVGAKLASKLSPAAVTPGILKPLMQRRGHPEYGIHSSQTLAVLGRRGLRIFVGWSGLEGEDYRAATVDELSRVDLPSVDRSEELASAVQPAAVDETGGRPGDEVTVGAVAAFPSRLDLQWSEVTIAFVSNDSVKISARGITKTYTFAEIGFKDRRKGDRPDTRWSVLHELARHSGRIDWGTKGAGPDPNRKRIKVISILRKRLQAIMGTSEDPFHDYRKMKGYVTKFKLEDKSYNK